MNETTLFLAQVFGPVLGILGLGMLINPAFYRDMFRDIGKANLSVMMSCMAMIAIGIILVMKHFLWETLPEILVSLIALSFLIKGSLWALFPRLFGRIAEWAVSTKLLIIPSFLWILGGGYLTWVGFFA